jgi:hypothetical protein
MSNACVSFHLLRVVISLPGSSRKATVFGLKTTVSEECNNSTSYLSNVEHISKTGVSDMGKSYVMYSDILVEDEKRTHDGFFGGMKISFLR